MDLEAVVLGEIRQGKTNIILFHLCVASKNQNECTNKNRNRLINLENILVVARGEAK